MNNNLISKGMNLLTQGELDSALETFKLVISNEPSNAMAYAGIATYYELKDDYNNSIIYFNKAIDYDPDYTLFFFHLGNVYSKFSINNSSVEFEKKAVDAYLIFLKTNPDHLHCLNNIANSLLRLGKYKDALTYYKKCISLSNNQANIFSNLGACYLKLNNFSESIKSFENAIKIDNANPIYYNNLGEAFLWSKDFKNAEINFLKSIKLNSNYHLPYCNLGNLYFITQNLELALKNILLSLKLNPSDHNSYLYLSNCYKVIGKTDDAISALVNCIKYNKFNYEAYYGLSVLKYSFDENTIQFLENIVDSEVDSFSDKAFCSFALWNHYNDNNFYSKAIDYLNIANSLMNDNAIKDNNENIIKKESIFFNKIKSNFIKKEFTLDTYRNDFVPIFILGMPRSGTSLVEQIISSHSKVDAIGEKGFLQSIMENNDYPSLLKNFSKKQYISINNEYYDNIISYIGNKSYFVTDKLPHNFLYIGAIKNIFPNAKIIHIKRNKEDNCLSIYSKLFLGDMPWNYNWNNILKYYDLYEDLMDFWNNNFIDFIYNIEYENLVKDPHDYIDKLLNFCDLDFEEQCLEFDIKNKRPVYTASFLQVREKIYTSSINKWEYYKDFLNEL